VARFVATGLFPERLAGTFVSMVIRWHNDVAWRKGMIRVLQLLPLGSNVHLVVYDRGMQVRCHEVSVELQLFRQFLEDCGDELVIVANVPIDCDDQADGCQGQACDVPHRQHGLETLADDLHALAVQHRHIDDMDKDAACEGMNLRTFVHIT
jgi:hypothetical protein